MNSYEVIVTDNNVFSIFRNSEGHSWFDRDTALTIAKVLKGLERVKDECWRVIVSNGIIALEI